MEGEGILQTFAEVSVAFAGFTGVVAVFAHRGKQGWARAKVAQFRTMLTASLATVIFSLLPFFLHHAGLTDHLLWRTSSGLLAVYLCWAAVGDTRHRRTVPVAAVGGWVTLFITVVFGTLVVVGQVVSAMGYFDVHYFSVYLGGLFFMVLISTLMFYQLLLAGISPPGSAG